MDRGVGEAHGGRRGDGNRGRLLGADDPPPVELVNPGGAAPVVFLCDHASNRIPEALGALGLPAEALASHIAWDIGAGEIARRLARRFDAPAVLSGYSRLVIDCNRALEDEQSILAVSDGAEVPGNRDVAQRDAADRVATFFRPYHEACAETLDRVEARGRTPPVVIMHSFTPALARGRPRPWDIGILWNRDGRIACPLLRHLRARGDLRVGDNQPYSGASPRGYTAPTHAGRLGRAVAQIEVRQDLVADEPGIARWTEILAAALTEVFKEPSLYERRAP